MHFLVKLPLSKENLTMEIKKPSTPEEIDEVALFTAKIFRRKSQPLYKFIKAAYEHSSFHRADLCWMLKEQGEIRAKVQFLDFTMQIGHCKVKMAGLNALAVAFEHWGEYYPLRLMEKAYFSLIEEGFDLIFGFTTLHEYYKILNAVQIMPKYQIIVEVKDIPQKEVPGFCQMKPEDWEKMSKIHNTANLGRRGIIERKAESWQFMLYPPTQILVAENGYIGFNFHNEQLELVDISGLDLAFYESALAKLAEIAHKQKLSQICAPLPPDHPFVHIARKYGLNMGVEYKKMQGGLGRVINLPSIIQKIRPELENRIKVSAFYNLELQFTLRSEEGETTVVLNKGASSKAKFNIHLPMAGITQLIFGTHLASIILQEHGVAITTTESEILNVLFPTSYPFAFPNDIF